MTSGAESSTQKKRQFLDSIELKDEIMREENSQRTLYLLVAVLNSQ